MRPRWPSSARRGRSSSGRCTRTRRGCSKRSRRSAARSSTSSGSPASRPTCCGRPRAAASRRVARTRMSAVRSHRRSTTSKAISCAASSTSTSARRSRRGERAAAPHGRPDAALPRRQALLGPGAARGRRRELRDRPRRDRRLGRRERQRQEHDRPPPRARVQAHPRRDLLRGPAAELAARAQATARVRERRPDGLPGPVLLDQPGLPGLARDQAGAAAASRGPGEAARSRARARRGRARAAREDGRQVPARAERRPAPAGRLRPGLGVQPEADHRRRARLDARRLDPDRAAEPDERAARARGRLVPLHHARRRERPLHRGPGARHVRRPPRRGGADRGRDPAPEAPVHAAARLRSPRSAGRARRGLRGRRRAAEGDQPDRGLPLPWPLSLSDRDLRHRDAAAAPAWATPPGCLPRRRARRRSASIVNAPGAGRHFLAEIHEQPAALLSLLERLDEYVAVGRACAERSPAALRLVAHGSSDAAASYGVYAFGLLPGWTALRDSISLTVYYGADLDFSSSVVVGLSQSGQTPDVVDYVERARKRGALTVGVTNDPGSALASASELMLPLEAGEEQSVAA